MATRETKRTKPVTKRIARADAPAKPKTRRLTKSLSPLAEPEPVAPALLVPVPVPAPVPVPVPVPEACLPPSPLPSSPPPPFAPIVRSTGGSRRALDTGAGAWVSVVYEGGATFCDDQAGVFVNGTRTRLRAPIAERLLTLDGFRMP
jgi:hypothetical protein